MRLGISTPCRAARRSGGQFLHEVGSDHRRSRAANRSSSTQRALGAAYVALGQTRKGQLLDVAIEGFDRRVRLGADEPFTPYYAMAATPSKDADTAVPSSNARRRAAFTWPARRRTEFKALRGDSISAAGGTGHRLDKCESCPAAR
jgi:hypothetical protein